LRHKVNDAKSVRDYFANPTSTSEKSNVHILERGDRIVLLTEHHRNKEQTISFISFFGGKGWKATASPARPAERSDICTTAGVLAAIKGNIDNRLPSFATDVGGKLTPDAQITGRLTVLADVETMVLSGYIECGLGFG